MRRVVTISLNGNAFALEEDAAEALGHYLESARVALQSNTDQAEILADLEQAIAEKSRRFLGAHKTVLTRAEMTQILTEMGPVENEPTASPDSAEPPPVPPSPRPRQTLYRIRQGQQVGGGIHVAERPQVPGAPQRLGEPRERVVPPLSSAPSDVVVADRAEVDEAHRKPLPPQALGGGEQRGARPVVAPRGEHHAAQPRGLQLGPSQVHVRPDEGRAAPPAGPRPRPDEGPRWERGARPQEGDPAWFGGTIRPAAEDGDGGSGAAPGAGPGVLAWWIPPEPVKLSV